MNLHKSLLPSLVFVLVAGCATTTLEHRDYNSYVVGHKSTATLGEPFLIDQAGSVERVRRWVGILNSPNGWATETRNSEDYVRKELVYAGKSGTTIEVSYREFRGGLAAPAFFQNLKYDLADSNIIRFQRFKIEVIAADNQTITYKILND